MSAPRLFTYAALALAASLIGACTQPSSENAAHATATAAHGYTLDVIAHEGEKIYLVRGGGKTAAARVTAAGSAMTDAAAAEALMVRRQSAANLAEMESRIALHAPGYSLQIDADETAPGEQGRARIDITAGGQRVLVDAEGGGDNDRAVVHIEGANAAAARDFIDEAEGLSAETRAQMRAALGL